MKSIKYAFYVTAVLIGLCAPSYATICSSEPFDLVINTNSPPEVILHNRSSKDLAAFLKAKALPGYVTQGLTVAKYQSGYTTEYRSQRLPDGRWCSRISRLTIDFGLSDIPYIYIAREVPKGGCLYNEVMKHEYEHLGIARKTVRDGRDILENYLKSVLSHNGVAAGSDQAGTQIIEARISKAVNDVTSRLYNLAEAKNMALDSPSNYAALGRVCR